MKKQDEATQDKPQAVKYKLTFPIQFGEEHITELSFSRPKGKHIKHIGAALSFGEILVIAQKVSGHPPSVFDELDAVDCVKISEIMGDFLSYGQGTGKNA